MNNPFVVRSRFANFFIIALVLSIFSLLNSCKDDTGGVGANVLPQSDLINGTQVDTTTVVTSMFVKDSCLTNDIINCLLGSYNDPIFGEAKASLYMDVLSPAYPTAPPWTSGTVLDSAVLLLPFISNNWYGNLDPQTFVVDTMENFVIANKTYFSDTNISCGPSPIAIQQVTPASDKDTLEIRLSNKWMNYIANKVQVNNNYYWSNFGGLVKGLYVTVSNPPQLPGQGAILYVPMYPAPFGGVYFYYHYIASPDTENYVQFQIGYQNSVLAPYFNHFDHNYSTSPFGAVRPSGKHDSVSANTLMYVQGMGGVAGRINFPNLYNNWKNKGTVAINDAEVILPVDAQADASYGPPGSLYLNGTNYDWQGYNLPDNNGQGWYNGNFNPFNNTYTFNITQYIQQVIQGKDTDRGLYVVPINSAISANRVVLYGAGNGIQTSKKTQLVLYYTPLGAKK